MKTNSIDLNGIYSEPIKDIEIIPSATNETYQKMFRCAENPKHCINCRYCEFIGSFSCNGEPLYGGGEYVCSKHLRGSSPSPMYQSLLCEEQNGFEKSYSEKEKLDYLS